MRDRSKTGNEKAAPRLHYGESLRRSAQAALRAFEGSGLPYYLRTVPDPETGRPAVDRDRHLVLEPVRYGPSLAGSLRVACTRLPEWGSTRTSALDMPPCLAHWTEPERPDCPPGTIDRCVLLGFGGSKPSAVELAERLARRMADAGAHGEAVDYALRSPARPLDEDLPF